MSTKKLYIKKIFAAALALSVITGTGVAALGASAKTSDYLYSVSEKAKSFKNLIAGVIKQNFDAEKAKELIAKLTEKVLSSIPDETKEKLLATIQLLSAEGFPEDMIRQLISDFADNAYRIASQTAQYLVQYAVEEYMNLPEEVRAQLEAQIQQMTDSMQKIETFVERVKTKTDKYTITEDGRYITLNEGDFVYDMHLSLTNGVEATAITYLGEETTVTVPASADGFKVTSAELFAATEVKSVKLPETITKLNGLVTFGLPYAKFIYVDAKNPYFKSVKGIVYDKEGTKLVAVAHARSFSPAEGVTSIGELAYFGTSMTTIALPSTVTSIDKMAFYGAAGLEEITIPSGVTAIEHSTFAACYALKKITIPSTVTKIADDAFLGIDQNAVFCCENNDDYAVSFAEKNGYQVSAPQLTEFNTPSLVMLGASANLSVNIKYGTGEKYTYSYLVRQVGAEKWTKLKMNSTSNTCTFTPSYTGYYEICIKAKGAHGNVIKSYSYMKVTQTANNRSDIIKCVTDEGTVVTVNCKAIDPKSEFAVYYKETSASKWTPAQKFSTNKSVEIALSKAGGYQICVKAKSSLGFISKVYFDVTVE